MKEPKKTPKNIVRQITSCITEKYNGFQAISIEFAKNERKQFKLINIIYKQRKNLEISPLSYFPQDISKAYINFYNVKDKTRRPHGCYECYYSRKFFSTEGRHKKHIENCAKVPGIVCHFNTKGLISF